MNISLVNKLVKGGGVIGTYAKALIYAIEHDASPTILTSVQKNAINYVITKLWNRNSVSPNLFRPDDIANSKIKALHIFVGATPNAHKYNAIDPRNLDAAFRLTYLATGGHDANGFTSASTRSADTKLVPLTTLASDCQLIIYVRSGSGMMGARKTAQYFEFWDAVNDNTQIDANVAANYTLDFVIKHENIISVKRIGTNEILHVNGYKLKDAAVAAAASLPDCSVYIGATNVGGINSQTAGYTNISTTIICNSISDSDELFMAQTIHEFNKKLSRGAILGDVKADAISYIDAVTTAAVTASKMTVTEVGDYNGLQFTKPSPTGYVALWLRDFYYMAQEGYITDTEILNCYNWHKSKIPTSGGNAYWVPDHILANGTINWTPGSSNNIGSRATLDGNPFMALLAIKHYQLSGDSAWMISEMAFLESLLTSVNYVDGLISYADGSEAVGWGFQDSVKMSGKMAYISAIYYDAFKNLNTAAIALSQSYSFGTYATAIKNNWLSTFWNGTYLKAATGKCSGQYDVSAAAYGVYIGLAEGQDAINIANNLYGHMSDIKLKGFYKYVPTSYYYDSTHLWEAIFGSAAIGTYQNGGYWAVTAPYFIYTLNLISPTFAKSSLDELCIFNRSHNRLPEWVNSTVTTGVINYGATGAQIKKAINVL